MDVTGWIDMISRVGFPIVVALLVLVRLEHKVAKHEDVTNLRKAMIDLQRNLVVLTVVLAKSSGVDYHEAKCWVADNND